MKIYLAGHRGLVGTALMKVLGSRGYDNLVTRTHSQLDLTDQAAVNRFFIEERPDAVILAAAKVGGIGANSTYPADFLYQNLMIAANVIQASYLTGVKKLINLGSSCIYPKLAPQPIREDALLTGPLEVTNEAYAVAKIAAIRLCKHYNDQYKTNYLSVMPTNLYGVGDNYDLDGSHVLPAMIRKFHEGKVHRSEVVLWGDGSPKREFLFAEDLAEAVLYVMENLNYPQVGELINAGSGEEVTIKELATLVAEVVGFNGSVRWDSGKPNGTMRKVMDSSRLRSMGWSPRMELKAGIRVAYQDFLNRYAHGS